MGSPDPLNDMPSERPGDSRHREYVDTLVAEELTLLILRDELYDGSWDEMRTDLIGRRQGKPFIFQLATLIDEDLERIDRLARYENEHNIDLGEFLEEEG